MKKFRFQLDTVLDYRRQVLDERQSQYARALEQVRQQERRKEDAEERYRQLNRRFREAAAVGVSAPEALSYESGLRILEREIARETQLLEQYRKTAEEKRSQVVEAHVDTAILDRLREKKLEAYHQEVQKSDERFIDELVSAARCGEAG